MPALPTGGHTTLIRPMLLDHRESRSEPKNVTNLRAAALSARTGDKEREEEKNRQISFHCSLFPYTIASKTGAFSFLSPTEAGDRGHTFRSLCEREKLESPLACATSPARLPCITPL
ncbi:hypothetical protein PBY51_012200 [Eleginops maclovinus]|uniref:Uncharacterized protein n=1 Tax=Eleginops maclovinus TaxID=56733 RepID=A0AAN7XVQ1_ELEMC|nr:hypothetical protein PBY51_012200 [Eleginops maclovinus]